MICDLEGSNNVDPLVSGFGQIYLTVKYICLVVLLSVLIFSKPTRVRAGILLQWGGYMSLELFLFLQEEIKDIIINMSVAL